MRTEQIQKELMAGIWKPNIYLTNLALAQFQRAEDFVATKLFPIVPVQLPTGKFYKFRKEDLARDNMQRKPAFGKVDPAVIGLDDESYDCRVDQLIIGIDQISAIPMQRTGAPGVADPRMGKTRAAAEQALLHLDSMYARKFFKAGAWKNEFEGVQSGATGKQFVRFDQSGSDPISFVDQRMMEIRREGRRKPNKIGLGYKTFISLKNNAAVLDRVKYNGGPSDPARVSEQALAQLFGVDEVVVLASTYNAAKLGEEADMQFVCDETGMLICYAPDAPMIDEPSAGYTFAWDMLGGNQYIAVAHHLGDPMTHSEYIEMLCAYDMKKTGDDLACYCKGCVG